MTKPRKVKIKYKNKVYTYFFKSYWLLMVIIIGLSAGLWLNYQMNKQVCGLQAVQCIGE